MTRNSKNEQLLLHTRFRLRITSVITYVLINPLAMMFSNATIASVY